MNDVTYELNCVILLVTKRINFVLIFINHLIKKNMKTIQMKNRKFLTTKKIMHALFLSLFVLVVASCDKENNTEKAQLSVLMTDAPAAYDAVLIDLQRVEVTGDGGNAIVLNTNEDIYNLLDLTNGVNTLIASSDMEPGTISQIRLILGPDNSVVVDGESYPLSTPSAEQSGLKLQVHQTFEPGVSYAIMLDFDANQSIVEKGNGEYQLKPVIRTIDVAVSGSVKGKITPAGTVTTITASSDGLTFYSSVSNSNGDFLVAGLPTGTYDVTVIPILPLLPVTLTGKTVTVGETTDVGIITF